MTKHVKLTVQAFNFIFGKLNCVESRVIWMRSPDYAKQLYVDATYEKIWGRTCEELYNCPGSWGETLDIENKDEVIQKLKLRLADGSESENTVFFRIRDLKGELHWIKDVCFHLLDASGQTVMVGGYGEEITPIQWKHELQQQKRIICKQEWQRQQEFLTILNKELALTEKTSFLTEQSNSLQRHRIKLTQRETDCLTYLQRGQTSKWIARMLGISPRTVEIHIDNIKKKFKCSTRLELISKLNHGNILSPI